MPPYSRDSATEFHERDRWSGGFAWVAHPDEDGQRTSHAIRTDEGVWLLDPLDAPGIDDRIADLGDVAGVIVCADYHARDADRFARRHDVPVTVPKWLDRPPELLDAPIDRVTDSLGPFELRQLNPLRAWRETPLYRECDGTLYVPDFLAAHPKFTVGGERVGMPSVSRLSPPREAFADIDPERILFGHGPPVLDDASAALADALDGARQRFPRALMTNLPGELRMMLGALR